VLYDEVPCSGARLYGAELIDTGSGQFLEQKLTRSCIASPSSCYITAQLWYVSLPNISHNSRRMLTYIGTYQEAHDGARKVGSRGPPSSLPPTARVTG
jgi:hypothetical protein